MSSEKVVFILNCRRFNFKWRVKQIFTALNILSSHFPKIFLNSGVSLPCCSFSIRAASGRGSVSPSKYFCNHRDSISFLSLEIN